tara:strand:+ start:199 stop:768 length:570 start_codon:yes stop_codon:yes gene_type:complete
MAGLRKISVDEMHHQAAIKHRKAKRTKTSRRESLGRSVMPATVGRSYPVITKYFGGVNLDRDREDLVALEDEINCLLGNGLKKNAENAFPNGEGATGEADTSKQRRYDFSQPAIWKPWDPNGTTVPKKSTLLKNVSELMGCLRRISRNQPNRASAILHRLLSREENTAIRKQVTATIDEYAYSRTNLPE